ncbi:cytochrome P450 [Hamadaea tsunoensis]|uniref:cytochrome P450 n=1 Tax=Hamadaea tsunoensis TaxID=53368 RepID=UPI000550A23E|nr:cytochrome P450 [Hamadaea tsunoensis]
MDALTAMSMLMTAEGRRDPYPLYEAIRAAGPVADFGEQVVVTGYAEADAVLRDPGMRVVDRAMLLRVAGPEWADRPAQRLMTDSLLNTNQPDHRRMRRIVSAAFTPRRVAGLADAVTAQAEHLAEAAAADAAVDLMAAFAVPLPVTVICELLGVPESDRAWFRPVALDFAETVEYAQTADGADRADAAARELRDYFIGLVADRLRTPTDDLTSELAHAEGLSGAELLGNLALLLLAGHETTTNLIGNGISILLQRPESQLRLRSDPAYAQPLVEEFLRFDPPVQMTTRVPAEATEIGAVTADHRTAVTVLIGAANRDPLRFNDPAVFDPDRPDNTPLSFGAGAHFCLGAALARLEGRIAFPLLLGRFPRIALGAPAVRRDRLVLRGYERLPVTLR